MAKIYFDNYSVDLARAKIFNALANEVQDNLFNVIELSSGDYLPKSKMENGKYKVYGGGGITSSTHTSYNVENETIGIGRVGARCGCVFIIEAKSWVTDNALFVSRFKKKFDLNFFCHYLNHINLNQFANQSAQPVISQRGIAMCTIPDVEFYKQEQIGAILNAIEKKEDFEDIYNLKNVLKFERNLALLNEELDQQQTYLHLLRQTILQEAVQGKLTQQDPTDEPATALLKRIKTEKEKGVKAGKPKKEKELPPITEDEIPFALPEGWIWCRLGEVCKLITDGTHLTPKYVEKGRIFLSAQNVKPFKFIPDKHKYVSDEDYQGYIKSRKADKGDVLLTRVGAGIGEAAVIDTDINFAFYVSLGLLKPSKEGIYSYYLELYLNSPLGREYSNSNTLGKGASAGNLNLSLIRNFKFPLPPLVEQQRIVAKVQQLQQQLSGLEAQVQKNREYAQQLLQSVLRGAFAPTGKKYVTNEDVMSLVAE